MGEGPLDELIKMELCEVPEVNIEEKAALVLRDGTLVCPSCNDTFRWQYFMWLHEVDKITLSCDIISFDDTFRTNLQLNTHMEKLHMGRLPCSYPDCEKTFKYKCNLKKHIRIHSSALKAQRNVANNVQYASKQETFQKIFIIGATATI